MRRIVILGGYGNFGKRICETLAAFDSIELMVTGRDFTKAKNLCTQLQASALASLQPCALNIDAEDFPARLTTLKPFLVIHTCGPFQQQDYRVPLACIAAGSHYIDLADDRRFVCDITSLDAAARAAGVALVSGASSVPGLSSCVIDHFLPYFLLQSSPQSSTLDEIDFAIAPGNKAERGMATLRAILSYTGHPLRVFKNGQWRTGFGWMSPRQMQFGKVVGERWLANVDVPDLELFPVRYAPVKTVNFQAGLELPVLHWGMVAMAWLAKKRWVTNWAPYTRFIMAASHLFNRFGTDVGGMQIHLRGKDHQQEAQHLVWTLVAENGVGPYIPTLSAIILTQKWLQAETITPGASACLGRYTLTEFDEWARRWGIYHYTLINGCEVACG